MRSPGLSEPGLYARLDAASTELDQLIGDVGSGVRGPAHFDELEERASKISRRITGAFRERNPK